MSHCTSHMIGLRIGGVFSSNVDRNELITQIDSLITQYQDDISIPFDTVEYCISHQLEAQKGVYVTIAGVFNYWSHECADSFCRILSQEFKIHVMHMSWDEEVCQVYSSLWKNGLPVYLNTPNVTGRMYIPSHQNTIKDTIEKVL